jgi:acyl carrier protein
LPGSTETREAPAGPDPAPPPSDAELTDRVLDQVRTVVAEVIGEDYVTELDIDMETAFRADLDIESIEFVAMGEVLREAYGSRIDFVEWLTTMELDDIIALTVGELVDHIVGKLRP